MGSRQERFYKDTAMVRFFMNQMLTLNLRKNANHFIKSNNVIHTNIKILAIDITLNIFFFLPDLNTKTLKIK